jgi:hypothetical protein
LEGGAGQLFLDQNIDPCSNEKKNPAEMGKDTGFEL